MSCCSAEVTKNLSAKVFNGVAEEKSQTRWSLQREVETQKSGADLDLN